MRVVEELAQDADLSLVPLRFRAVWPGRVRTRDAELENPAPLNLRPHPWIYGSRFGDSGM